MSNRGNLQALLCRYGLQLQATDTSFTPSSSPSFCNVLLEVLNTVGSSILPQDSDLHVTATLGRSCTQALLALHMRQQGTMVGIMKIAGLMYNSTDVTARSCLPLPDPCLVAGRC